MTEKCVIIFEKFVINTLQVCGRELPSYARRAACVALQKVSAVSRNAEPLNGEDCKLFSKSM